MAIDVVLCGDRRVIKGMAVSGRSALENVSEPINFYVIHQGYSADDQQALRDSWQHEKLGGVEFKEIDDEKIQSFRSTLYLKSKSCYSRYFVAELFPTIERCVYLDTDLIVSKDIAEAARLDLGDAAIAAVRDIFARRTPDNPEMCERLGLKTAQNYFNSGFLVIDVAAWREESVAERLCALSVERADALHSQDQDALNILFEDKVLLIDESWNTSQYEQPETLDGRIVHLIGTVKPWHASYRDKFVEPYYADVIWRKFYEVLDRTAFSGWRPGDFFGAARLVEKIQRRIPTLDMVAQKITGGAKAS